MANKKLTDAQVFTLRRMLTGTSYILRGDGLKGDEQRPTISVSSGRWYPSTDAVNSPSLPVLFRKGFVEFTSKGLKDPSIWYSVRLTEEGAVAAATFKTSSE